MAGVVHDAGGDTIQISSQYRDDTPPKKSTEEEKEQLSDNQKVKKKVCRYNTNIEIEFLNILIKAVENCYLNEYMICLGVNT